MSVASARWVGWCRIGVVVTGGGVRLGVWSLRTGGDGEAVAWDSWPLRGREGACRGSMDAPPNASCGGRAGGEPLADSTVIVDWERVRSFMSGAFAYFGLSASPFEGPGVALLPRPSFTNLLSHSGASVVA